MLNVHMDVHIETFDIERREVLATFGPVLIRVFAGPTDIPGAEQGRALVQQLLERWPVVGLWSIAHHGAAFPDAPTRRYSSRAFDFGDRLVIVQTVLGLGFWADAARATAVAIARVMGTTVNIESSVEAGAQRLAMEMVGLDPDRLIAVHARLFAQLDAGMRAHSSG